MAGDTPPRDPHRKEAGSQRLRPGFDIENTMRLLATCAEREKPCKLRHSFHIEDETLRRVPVRIDLARARLLGPIHRY